MSDTPARRTRPSYQEWRDDPKRRGTIAVRRSAQAPRPAATPVPETDRRWRPSEFVF